MRSAVGWRSHVQKWLGSHRPFNTSLLVVKYENLFVDLRTELTKIMKHLEYSYTEEDMNCTINSSIKSFHRKHSKYIEHFNESQVDNIYKQIQLANQLLKNYNISYEKHKL